MLTAAAIILSGVPNLGGPATVSAVGKSTAEQVNMMLSKRL